MLPRCHLFAASLALLVCAAAHAEPFRDQQFRFNVNVPEGWAIMPPKRVRDITEEFARRPNFKDVIFYGGFWRKIDKGQEYPYVLVQVLRMPPNLRTHKDVANWLSLTNGGQKVLLLDVGIDAAAKYAVDEMVVDVPNNRAVSVREAEELVRKPKPGKPNEWDEEKMRLRTISVGFLGQQHLVIFHYFDRAEGFGTRTEAFDQLIGSFRFDEQASYKPTPQRLGFSEEKIDNAPTREQAQQKNVGFGALLALGLGVLCALFVWRAKIGDVLPMQKHHEGEQP